MTKENQNFIGWFRFHETLDWIPIPEASVGFHRRQGSLVCRAYAEPSVEVGSGIPMAYLHVKHGQPDKTRAVVNFLEESPFGDLGEEYEVTSDPLYLIPPTHFHLMKALREIGDEVLEGTEPFRSAVVRILKTVGIDPLNGQDPQEE